MIPFQTTTNSHAPVTEPLNPELNSPGVRRSWMRNMREPFNGLSHLIAAGAGLAGLVYLLVLGRGDWLKELSLAVYGISVVLLFSASGIYHLVKADEATTLRLRKLDHSSIFLLIAGSYTPICLHFFTGFFQWGLPLIVWSIALIGVTIKIFVIKAPRWITAGIYLIMGWLCVMALGQMLSNIPPAGLFWMILGGVAYSVGALIYILKKPDFFPGVFGFHEIWHIFVILGALSHFILVAVFIAPA